MLGVDKVYKDKHIVVYNIRFMNKDLKNQVQQVRVNIKEAHKSGLTTLHYALKQVEQLKDFNYFIGE